MGFDSFEQQGKISIVLSAPEGKSGPWHARNINFFGPLLLTAGHSCLSAFSPLLDLNKHLDPFGQLIYSTFKLIRFALFGTGRGSQSPVGFFSFWFNLSTCLGSSLNFYSSLHVLLCLVSGDGTDS